MFSLQKFRAEEASGKHVMQGESKDLVVKMALDYNTGEVGGLSFEVPISSFKDSASGNISLLGNEKAGSNMFFVSNYKKKNHQMEVKGKLEFKGNTRPYRLS